MINHPLQQLLLYTLHIPSNNQPTNQWTKIIYGMLEL